MNSTHARCSIFLKSILLARTDEVMAAGNLSFTTPTTAVLLMNRRHLLAMIGGTTFAGHSMAAERPHIGFVSGGDSKGAEEFVAALRDGLASQGYREPETLTLDLLYADYSLERIPALVAEIERRGAELIVAHAAATTIVVKHRPALIRRSG
jgi:hypothetical protein